MKVVHSAPSVVGSETGSQATRGQVSGSFFNSVLKDCGLAVIDKQRKRSGGMLARPCLSTSCSPAFTGSPARPHRSAGRPCQCKPGRCRWHLHIWVCAQAWPVLLTGCGLWSHKGRFRRWLNANVACAGFLGRRPRPRNCTGLCCPRNHPPCGPAEGLLFNEC